MKMTMTQMKNMKNKKVKIKKNKKGISVLHQQKWVDSAFLQKSPPLLFFFLFFIFFILYFLFLMLNLLCYRIHRVVWVTIRRLNLFVYIKENLARIKTEYDVRRIGEWHRFFFFDKNKYENVNGKILLAPLMVHLFIGTWSCTHVMMLACILHFFFGAIIVHLLLLWRIWKFSIRVKWFLNEIVRIKCDCLKS